MSSNLHGIASAFVIFKILSENIQYISRLAGRPKRQNQNARDRGSAERRWRVQAIQFVFFSPFRPLTPSPSHFHIPLLLTVTTVFTGPIPTIVPPLPPSTLVEISQIHVIRSYPITSENDLVLVLDLVYAAANYDLAAFVPSWFVSRTRVLKRFFFGCIGVKFGI
ncbi:hypothetical protein L218DRAFT_578827 [Marasmius fiardii PR-910]|nr:hypothetical protein L218DRAFT_578827 [Marasmius fiardii PR-910]